MIAINQNNSKVYEGSAVFIASIVGVHRNTLSRWAKIHSIEHYNQFIIYFEVVKKCAK